MIISVVGMPGSGKSEVCKIIQKKLDGCLLSTGNIIREGLKKRGLKNTPENEAKVRKWFHSGREDLIVKRLWKKVKNHKAIIIDGFRTLSEVKLLEKISHQKVAIISVYAPFNARLKRIKKRGRFGTEDISYLKKRDLAESRVGLKKLIKNADYIINNSKTRRELRINTLKTIKKIL